MTNLACETKGTAISRTLRHAPLFAGVSAAQLTRIGSITVLKTLAKGDYLFREGLTVHGVYVVRKGAIKLHRVNALGKEQVIHVYRAMESLAEESLLSDTGYPADACATEPTQVLLIQKAGFLAMLKREPDLALCLLRSMDRHLQLLVGLLDDLTLKDVKTRFANWLIQQCPDPESRKPVIIHLTSTKRVLAAELGTVSETLSRTVAKFRDLQLLSVDGDTVTLLCPVRLAELFGNTINTTTTSTGTGCAG